MTFDSELFELAGAREPKQRRLTRAQKRAGSQSCRQGQLKAAGNNEDAVTDKLEVNAREVKELQDSDETLEELRRLAENGDPRFIRKNSLLYRRERQLRKWDVTKISVRAKIGLKPARACVLRLKHVEESCEHKMSSSEEDEVKENLVEEAYQYLRRKSYPAGASEERKRCIRRKAAKFVLKNGELFFKKMNKGKESEIRYVVNTEEQQRILHGCHNDPTAGHMGVKRTLKRINARFRWPGMVKDVTNMVARCDICQRANRKLVHTAPELHPVPVKSPWHHIRN
eukprot:Em0022g239a